ncbi:hypothetical protein QFZ28_005842 [Neobacillus niacini]|jgi:hypothetical protein|nr:hypothetical protein [Neobacillus niacini]
MELMSIFEVVRIKQEIRTFTQVESAIKKG